nr:MAG TPA: hypothetical protein [Caudoviricetes sp.]
MSILSSGTVRGVLNAATITGAIGNGIARVDGSTDPYLGEYEVTPKVDAQTMPCAGKKMLKDVDIKAIPFFETSNEAGTTVYIAAEVD